MTGYKLTIFRSVLYRRIADNRLPLAAPDNYDPARYELAARRDRSKRCCQPVSELTAGPLLQSRLDAKSENGHQQFPEGISTDFIGRKLRRTRMPTTKRASQNLAGARRITFAASGTSCRLVDRDSRKPSRMQFQSVWPLPR